MKNIVASIQDRLKQLSKEQGEDFHLLLERFVMSRFFARLGSSPHRDHFILKGAQLFLLFEGTSHRPTRDADFLSFGNPDPQKLKMIFQEICKIQMKNEDGLVWKVDQIGPIREDNIYGGVRSRIMVLLGKMKIPLQIDVGFGDAITPEPRKIIWENPLSFPSTELLAYQIETSIAEKLHAAAVLAETNSRMKDFFDLHWLQQNQSFDFVILREAILATFERRGTPMPEILPLALTDEFAQNKMKQLQ